MIYGFTQRETVQDWPPDQSIGRQMAASTTSDPVPKRTPRAVKTPAHQNVYAQMRAMILFGDLAPGQAVTIQGLVETLDAGMTPVREAIRRLVAEGALTHQGNRRITVPVLGPEGVEELGFMRLAMEPELARRATTRITESALAQLQQIDAALNNAIARGDVGGYLTQNYQFHAVIYSVANAPIMAATVDQLWLRFGPSWRVVCGRFGTSNLPDKHADLLDALKAGNPKAAGIAMAEDITQGIDQVRIALSEG